MKVPYTIVIGAKEVESQKVTPRVRADIKADGLSDVGIEEFLQKVAEQAANRSASL
jgi:threonyl-tRNA synthetase